MDDPHRRPSYCLLPFADDTVVSEEEEDDVVVGTHLFRSFGCDL